MISSTSTHPLFLGKLPSYNNNNNEDHPIHKAIANRPPRPFITIPPPATNMETITPTVDDLSPSTTCFQSKLQLWENRSWNSNSPKEEQKVVETKNTTSCGPAIFQESTTKRGNQKNILVSRENRFMSNPTTKEETKKPFQLRPICSRPVLRETTNNNVQHNSGPHHSKKKVSNLWESRIGKSQTSDIHVQIQKPFQRQPRESANVNSRKTHSNKNVVSSSTLISTSINKQTTASTTTIRNTANKKSVLARYNPTPTTTFVNKARPVVPRRPASKSGPFQSSFAIFEDPPASTRAMARHSKARGNELLRSLLEKLETVRRQCKGNTGCLDIQGLCSLDTIETISDLDRCEWTADQVENIRVVLLPPDRQHIMDAIGRFLFGFQFHCRRRQLKPSFLEKLVQCLETLDRLYQLEIDKNPPLLFNILLGTTYHLYMELPKFQKKAFPKDLCSMLAQLGQRWKDLLALHTLPQLKVDSKFSYPATQVLTTWLESIASSS